MIAHAGRNLFFLVLSLVFIVTIMSWGCPYYNVWERGLAGEAELRQAEWNRQIAVMEANAKYEASKRLAEAEVERAKGVAQANKIIGEGLKENEAYLIYLWIQSLGTNAHDVIYVPTEVNLPILEAGRFSKLTAPTPKAK